MRQRAFDTFHRSLGSLLTPPAGFTVTSRSLGMTDCCGLARNDTFYCHPDRGPNGPPPCHPEGASGASELRDLWSCSQRASHWPQIPRLASLARDDRVRDRYARSLGMTDCCGLARSDTFYCHPDRGPKGFEWRDLWDPKEEGGVYPARVFLISARGSKGNDSPCSGDCLNPFLQRCHSDPGRGATGGQPGEFSRRSRE